nr:EF-hand calcium-binding domain-containing protein 3 [Pogona vitticeps]
MAISVISFLCFCLTEDGTVNLKDFMWAVQGLSSIQDKQIDIKNLESLLSGMGIYLTQEELQDALKLTKYNATTFHDHSAFLPPFLFPAPKKGDMETVDARGILFFELLSKLVETSVLPRKTTVNIVSYYRQKFLESTGRKAWRADSIDEEKEMGRGGKKRHVPKARSTPLSSFAGAARICIMNDKELEDYVEHLRFRASTAPSDSPYAQVPIFPLIPNRDCLVKGRPKVDLQKLEVQRRLEPISSFEDHFFRKKRWLQQEAKLSKNPKASLTLTPELTRKCRRLTMDNLNEIRREVKRATDAYRKAIALRERNKSLKLWRRLRGGEIGLESRNPSFYQTFSTYSWSWNVCQELVTPRELREYDNRLYHHHGSRTPTFADKQIRAGGREKGNK